MALFQPFKPTKRMPGSNLVEATYRQALLDQQARRDEQAIRAENQNTYLGLGSDALDWNEDKGNPIGNYLRNMYTDAKVGLAGDDQGTQGIQVAGQGMQSPRSTEDDLLTETVTPGGMSPADQPSALSAQPGVDGNAPISDLTVDQPIPGAGGDGGLFSDTYTPPSDFGMEHLQAATTPEIVADVGDGGAMPDDSLRASIEQAFAQFSGDAATEAGAEATTEAITDTAMDEATTEAITDTAMDETTDMATKGFTPGLGTVMTLAKGNTEQALAKHAVSLLPPPYNMLSFLV